MAPMKKNSSKATLLPESIDIHSAVAEVESLLAQEKALSPALIAAVKMLLLVVRFLAARLGLNSKNSSKPPSSDLDNSAEANRNKSGKPKGGQPGHTGLTLEQVDDPDDVTPLLIDRDSLPPGNYQEVGYERRQVIDIRISRRVTEYQAQILESDNGTRFTAAFPHGVNRPAQYGNAIKANAVYMSMFQLIPYDRVQQHFDEMFGIPISTGSLFNFNKLAYHMLEQFEMLARQQLIDSALIHADETGINVNGKRLWLHNASNGSWTLIAPHQKRGQIAMDEIGVLPYFRGVLCHDHWKPYYRYEQVSHSLCNAHHLRELLRAEEQDEQAWAKEMHTLLTELRKAVKAAGGRLQDDDVARWQIKYRALLDKADIECPPPPEPINKDGKKKRGRVARSKARNLLERLRDFEDDVLRFMKDEQVPFTNNQGERDIRMTKVQQKISGCFRSMEGAKIFCRVRSYISTCQKNNVGVGQALECLFAGKMPDFIQEKLDEFRGAE